MDVNALINMLTEGLSPEQATVVRQAIERDAVKQKAAALKDQTEYQALQNQYTQAAEYQKWYGENYSKVEQLAREHQERSTALAAYEQKFGKLDQQTPQVQQQVKQMTAEEIQAEVDKRVREQYAPRWSDVVVSTGTILQKHLMSGRKTEIDFNKLAEEANAKYQGDLRRAYEEWDKPERERIAKEEQDKEINRRVNEELQRRGASAHFPIKEDMSHGALSARTKDDAAKFDRTALNRELTEAFIAAGNGDPVQ